MSLCILSASGGLVLAVTGFTLGWQHSVEHVGWLERWSVEPRGLRLVEAQLRGSGAGMDPGPGARLRDGWWVWQPSAPPVPELVLAASGATGGGWQLCHAAGCLTLGADAGPPIRLRRCPGAEPPP